RYRAATPRSPASGTFRTARASHDARSLAATTRRLSHARRRAILATLDSRPVSHWNAMPSASHKTLSVRHVFKPAACIGLLLVAGFAPSSAHACATCGCTLSTDAATGYSTQSGWRLNLDDTWINQNSLRHGHGKATPQQVVEQPSDPSLGGGEIEKGTSNRYANLTVAYRFDADWGVSAVLPYVSRDHTTYGEQQSPYTPAATAPDQVSSARVAGI